MPMIHRFTGVLDIAKQVEARKARLGDINLTSGTTDAKAEATAVRQAQAAAIAAAKTPTKAKTFKEEKVDLDN